MRGREDGIPRGVTTFHNTRRMVPYGSNMYTHAHLSTNPHSHRSPPRFHPSPRNEKVPKLGVDVTRNPMLGNHALRCRLLSYRLPTARHAMRSLLQRHSANTRCAHFVATKWFNYTRRKVEVKNDGIFQTQN